MDIQAKDDPIWTGGDGVDAKRGKEDDPDEAQDRRDDRREEYVGLWVSLLYELLLIRAD